jgi:hypothetical protein
LKRIFRPRKGSKITMGEITRRGVIIVCIIYQILLVTSNGRRMGLVRHRTEIARQEF